MEPSGDVWRANVSLIGEVSTREIMVLKRAAKGSLAVNAGMAEAGGHSSKRFVTDLKEMVEGNSSAKSTMNSGSAEDGDDDAFEDVVAQCLSVE